MFVRVDIPAKDSIDGFSYINKDAEEERVSLDEKCPDVVTINTDYQSVDIYTCDIPHLIKALEAAYKHLGSPE